MSKYRLITEIVNFVLLTELQILPDKKILIVQLFYLCLHLKKWLINTVEFLTTTFGVVKLPGISFCSLLFGNVL